MLTIKKETHDQEKAGVPGVGGGSFILLRLVPGKNV